MAKASLQTLFRFAAKILVPVMEMVSPEIRKALIGFILDWEIAALATDNIGDDIAVGLIVTLLGITKEDRALHE